MASPDFRPRIFIALVCTYARTGRALNLYGVPGFSSPDFHRFGMYLRKNRKSLKSVWRPRIFKNRKSLKSVWRPRISPGFHVRLLMVRCYISIKLDACQFSFPIFASIRDFRYPGLFTDSMISSVAQRRWRFPLQLSHCSSMSCRATREKWRVWQGKTGQNYFIVFCHSVVCAVCCFDWLFSAASASGANGQVEVQFAA